MAKKRVESEAPDPFLKTVSQAWDWALRHKALLGAVIVIILLAAGSIWGWYSYKTTYDRKSGLLFSQALRVYHGVKPDAQDEGVKEAVKAFQKVVKGYPHSLWAFLAHLYLGRCYELLGNKNKAIQEFSLGISGIKSKKYLFPQWLVAFAQIQDPQKGIETVNNKLSEETPFLEPYLRYNLAFFYQEKGDIDRAIKTLEDLKGRFPDSPFGWEAARILEVLK